MSIPVAFLHAALPGDVQKGSGLQPVWENRFFNITSYIICKEIVLKILQKEMLSNSVTLSSWDNDQ